ncbi:hypothetical protein AAFF_G00312160 [Aldrovandia affinis]|uniref:Sjoegren syndrome/scleroderma autoantigen 1 n=1 Tax=Aldrovandia affinis TaxID=143900 RepID=A0AAD7WRL1_9TELE|nr:hypothetical protein AAFF_G00312160 [Aldrovandia affinis]
MQPGCGNMSLTAENDDFEWEPPSEAEMKCGTILLQDKQKKNYCVACQELDSDVDKDNPALNAQAALSQVRERQLAANQLPLANGTPPSDPSLSVPGLPRPEHCEGAASGLRGPLLAQIIPATTLPAPPPPATAPPVQPSQSPVALPIPVQHPTMLCAEEAVLQKMRWASQELQQASSVEASIQLCSLIRSCADSLRSLRELQQS